MRAAAYIRVSTEDQTKGLSLDAQRHEIKERAAADELELAPEHTFEDAGISGATAERPAYQAMLAAAAAADFEILYVWKFDRLGRDAEELLRARRMLEAAGVRLVSLTEGEAEGTLIYGVRALVAQEEREKIGERTRLGLAAIARSGRQPCGQPPLGYRAVGEKRERRWVVNPGEAVTVRRIFADYLSGVGINRLAAGLNADGITTRRGAKFGPRAVLDVLRNESYLGHVRLKGEVVAESAHEAIVDEVTYREAERLRCARRSMAGSGRGRQPKGVHLFVKGLLRCGKCGGAMGPRENANGWEHYRCLRRHTHGSEACSMPAIARERVDQAFLDFFEEQVLDPDGVVDTVREEAGRAAAEAEARAEQADRDLAQAEAGKARADRAFLNGSILEETYERLTAITAEEGAAAEAEAERHRARAEQLAAELRAFDADAEAAARLIRLRETVAGRLAEAESVEALRAAALTLCESVVLADREDGEGRTLEIRPTFSEGVWASASALRLPPRPADLQGEQSEAEAPSPPGRLDRRGRRSRTPTGRSGDAPRRRRAGRPRPTRA